MYQYPFGEASDVLGNIVCLLNHLLIKVLILVKPFFGFRDFLNSFLREFRD